MPSSVGGSGSKARSIRVQNDVLRGANYSEVPDFTVTANFAAAQIGANAGFLVWIAPATCHFLGGDVIWTTAGADNTIRVKKIPAASVEAPGAAADADNIDISEEVDVTTTANTAVEIVPVTDDGVHVLEQGDKVAIASSAGVATLAGGFAVLRFAYI